MVKIKNTKSIKAKKSSVKDLEVNSKADSKADLEVTSEINSEVKLNPVIKEDTSKESMIKEDTVNKSKKSKTIISSVFSREHVMTEDSDAAREFYNQSRYGAIQDSNKVQLSLMEALFLKEKGRLAVKDGRGKDIDFDSFVKKATKIEPSFWTKYRVFKDLRTRGYIVKTALKFGADFRVYDRGVKPGEDHARWIVYPVHEGEHLTWYEFSAKNRVAHSTKKRLLIGVVDAEGDVTYYEIRWIRP